MIQVGRCNVNNGGLRGVSGDSTCSDAIRTRLAVAMGDVQLIGVRRKPKNVQERGPLEFRPRTRTRTRLKAVQSEEHTAEAARDILDSALQAFDVLAQEKAGSKKTARPQYEVCCRALKSLYTKGGSSSGFAIESLHSNLIVKLIENGLVRPTNVVL
jgi:hypothetical protein